MAVSASGPSSKRTAFERLLSEHMPDFLRYAYHLCSDWDRAHDLLGEALYQAFASFGRFKPGTRFDHWVRRIIFNRHIDQLRRDQRRIVLPLERDAADDAHHPELADTNPLNDPAELLVHDVTSQEMEEALARLNPGQKSILTLFYFLDASYEDIADELRIPVGTVRSRLHRARERLRELLGDDPRGATP